jgi:hypothetical protein
MIRKILPLALILFLGCSSNEENSEECQPHYFYKDELYVQLIDHQSGLDLLQSGEIDIHEITVVKSGDNQPINIVETIIEGEDHCVTIPLYSEPASFSFQLKRNNVDLFSISCDLKFINTVDCFYGQAIENFNVDNYAFDEDADIFRIYL